MRRLIVEGASVLTAVVNALALVVEYGREIGVVSPLLVAMAGPVYASLSMKGALFTADMDTEAFPPIGETRMLGAARTLLRSALGFARGTKREE